MIYKKSSNNDLEVLATKSGPWAFYKTKTAANNDLANIPEGSIVAIEEASSTAIDSLPVGTWASFENTDSAPNSQWIKAGTTFDEDDYPELYLYLGTNIVPSRYDHSRLGDYQSISLPTTSGTAMTMQYDGVLVYVPRSTSVSNVYINGTAIYADDGGNDAYGSATINFKIGDVIYATVNGSQYSKVAYYTKPLFIKAKSFVEDSVPNAAIETVKDYTKSYVDTKNTYSTEETLTGGTWIDGKPIYRKAGIYNNGASTGTEEVLLDSTLTSSYVDKVILVGGNCQRNTDKFAITGYNGESYRATIAITNNGLYKRSSTDPFTNFTWWVEYTKTTD